jgi:HSP20 family molecular chaperone IbpA
MLMAPQAQVVTRRGGPESLGERVGIPIEQVIGGPAQAMKVMQGPRIMQGIPIMQGMPFMEGMPMIEGMPVMRPRMMLVQRGRPVGGTDGFPIAGLPGSMANPLEEFFGKGAEPKVMKGGEELGLMEPMMDPFEMFFGRGRKENAPTQIGRPGGMADISEIFNRLSAGRGPGNMFGQDDFNISDTQESFQITAHLPGHKLDGGPDDNPLHVQIAGRQLLVQGRKIEGPVQMSFQRSFHIPCTAEESKINVQFSTTTGKLIASIPKRPKKAEETDAECEEKAEKAAMAKNKGEPDEDPFEGVDDVLARIFGPPMMVARPKGFLASPDDSDVDSKVAGTADNISSSLKSPKPLEQPTWKVARDEFGVPTLEVKVPEGQALNQAQGKLYMIPGDNQNGNEPSASLGAPPPDASGKVEVPLDLNKHECNFSDDKTIMKCRARSEPEVKEVKVRYTSHEL